MEKDEVDMEPMKYAYGWCGFQDFTQAEVIADLPHVRSCLEYRILRSRVIAYSSALKPRAGEENRRRQGASLKGICTVTTQ